MHQLLDIQERVVTLFETTLFPIGVNIYISKGSVVTPSERTLRFG